MLCMRGWQSPEHAGSAGPTGSAPSAGSSSRTIRIEAIVTDKHGTPIANLRPEDFTLPRQRRRAENRRRRVAIQYCRRGRAGRAARARSRTLPTKSARREQPGTRLIALYLDEYHVSAGESTERVRARRVPLHRRAGASGRSPRRHEAARPSDGHPLHARSRPGAESRQQLQRAPQRLHAALDVRGAVSRPIAGCGARRARADRDVRLARAGHQDGGSQGRALGASC